MNNIEPTKFEAFPKMPRLNRDCVITEKIDGTNAQIHIEQITPLPDEEDGSPSNSHEVGWTYFPVVNGVQLRMRAGSRTRYLSIGDDNFGFAGWVQRNALELVKLGPGRHFGEWWGAGIQRKYGMGGKLFSLFNVARWCLHGAEPMPIPNGNPKAEIKYQEPLPACCGLVPVLYRGPFNTNEINVVLRLLKTRGSQAAPGFMDPEGIIVFHTAANHGFKVTLKDDGVAKSSLE